MPCANHRNDVVTALQNQSAYSSTSGLVWPSLLISLYNIDAVDKLKCAVNPKDLHFSPSPMRSNNFKFNAVIHFVAKSRVDLSFHEAITFTENEVNVSWYI